jgi:hypothetical protein
MVQFFNSELYHRPLVPVPTIFRFQIKLKEASFSGAEIRVTSNLSAIALQPRQARVSIMWTWNFKLKFARR